MIQQEFESLDITIKSLLNIFKTLRFICFFETLIEYQIANVRNARVILS